MLALCKSSQGLLGRQSQQNSELLLLLTLHSTWTRRTFLMAGKLESSGRREGWVEREGHLEKEEVDPLSEACNKMSTRSTLLKF